MNISPLTFNMKDGTQRIIPFKLPTALGKKRGLELEVFSHYLKKIDEKVGFKVSSRGWAYQLEGFRLINKDQFDLCENVINDCRKKGYLPIDFVAEEEGRRFSGIEAPESESPIEYLKRYLEAPLNCDNWYTPDWWNGEEYYIQMLVEKIDLKSLFGPVCKKYHIPVATSKGWSSMLQRAEYARRFKEAEDKELKCVLLYCGDHDPDGLRISEFIRSNLEDIRNITWTNGIRGYDPSDLTIERFGLNFDFIMENNLTWIDNLITGSGKNLASPTHPNNKMEYVQTYLAEIGERKCEANALVTRPAQGQDLCREAIEGFVGPDALDRFDAKREEVTAEMDRVRTSTGLTKVLRDAIDLIDKDLETEGS